MVSSLSSTKQIVKIMETVPVSVKALETMKRMVEKLDADNKMLLAALMRADDFIDGIREDLHSERTANCYPEGVQNAARSMSESMRLIGNRCADFDAAQIAIQQATKEPTAVFES
jgi:tRNA-dihydrouridine synthase